MSHCADGVGVAEPDAVTDADEVCVGVEERDGVTV